MRLPHHPLLWSSAFLFWFGFTWWLSSAVREIPEPADFWSADKIFHFGWYFGGAGLFSAFLHAWKPTMPDGRRHLATFLVVFLCGGIDEIHQSMVPGRDASFGDIAADGLGALVGALAFTHIIRRFPALLPAPGPRRSR